MASIADIVTQYQTAQKSYERAIARAGASADVPWTGKSTGIAGRALAASGNAVQLARMISDARNRLGSELAEKLLEAACKGSALATEAAEQAAELSVDLCSLTPLAGAGDRTREGAARIADDIDTALKGSRD